MTCPIAPIFARLFDQAIPFSSVATEQVQIRFNTFAGRQHIGRFPVSSSPSDYRHEIDNVNKSANFGIMLCINVIPQDGKADVI
jgi:hypothetical protein